MPQTTAREPVDLAREADFALGSIRVKPASREVIIGGQPEILEPRVLQVLVSLAQRRGEVVSRDDLSARCWEGRAVGEDALNRCIARIRRLAESSGQFTIETIPRVGYRLVAAAAIASDPETSTPLPIHERRAVSTSYPVWAVFATIVVLVGGAAFAYFAWRNSRAIEVSLDEHAIIVLPFRGLNADPDSQHFAESIAASITNALSQSGARVIAPTTAEKFRGADRARAAEETGARFIIDGEVRREGNRIRAVVRVDDGHTARTLMSHEFESDVAGQAALADQVAGYFGIHSYFFRQRTINVANAEVDEAWSRAFELYLDGKTRAALDLAKDTARKYPNDAQALTLLAQHSAIGYWWLPQEEVAPTLRAARVAAQRATDLAPYFGDNYFALSMLVPPQHWGQREAYLRKGVEIEPDAGSGLVLSNLLAQVGRLRASGELASGVAGRDPFNPDKVIGDFEKQRLLGNQVAADSLEKMGERYWPQYSFVWTRFQTSDFRAGAAEPARMMRDPSFAAMLEPDGQPPYIRQVLRALASRKPADVDAAVKGCMTGWTSYQTATGCLLGMSELGRLDDAFQHASMIFSDMRVATPEVEDEKWMRRETPFVDTTVLYRAETAPMRADPRFITLAESIGLLGYWRAGHPPDFCEVERVPVCEALRVSSKESDPVPK